jgi:hypothetical protein
MMKSFGSKQQLLGLTCHPLAYAQAVMETAISSMLSHPNIIQVRLLLFRVWVGAQTK